MTGCGNISCGSYQKWYVGNDIRNILLADADIVSAVTNNIYPLIAPEKVTGDFIIYGREKYSKSWTKIGVYEDSCTVAVTAISDNYDNAVKLASLIDNALTGKHSITVGQRNITLSIDLTDSTETFADLKYVEVLYFTIK